MADLNIGVITCSDSCCGDGGDDPVGHLITDECAARGWDVIAYHVCPDDVECVIASIIELCDVDRAHIVLTAGGTGLEPCDITPEATLMACDREVPGIAELIRLAGMNSTPGAVFFRGVACQRGSSLVVNLPGGVDAVRETLEVVIDHFEPAVEAMAERQA